MQNRNNSKQDFYETEVIDSSVIDEGILKKILLKAGRAIAQPAFEAFEIMIDPYTPSEARLSMLAALTYLVMPLDLMPDFIPVGGFSDDLVALTAVISLWKSQATPPIKQRAREKLDKLFNL
tara:strand:- start:1120 stop:1485 length:366 start_codon:yes stop_codon:yes gene_type:complete